jgi:glycosyltransferase involved in cell wall biosynthesis
LSKGSSELAVIQFGPIVKAGGEYHQSRQYAEFYGDLSMAFRGVTITAGYLLPQEPGAALSNEASLGESGARIRAFRGNAATTALLPFIINYLRAFPVVVRSVLEARRVLVFGPCLIGAVAMFVCKLAAKPFGFYWANDWINESKFRADEGGWRRLTNTISSRLVQALTVRAAGDAAFVITPSYELYKGLREQSVVAHMPVPLVKIRKVLGGPRKSCYAADGRITLLYVGELRQPKGLDVLVEAFLRIKANGGPVGKAVALRFAGDGEMKDQLLERVRMSGHGDVVTFCGHVSDEAALAREYLAASIFVLPSRSEGFPRVLYEAMAAGLPIIATRVGGIPGLLRDGIDALLVPPGDADGIVTGIHRLAGDDFLYQQMSERCLRVFEERVVDRIRAEGSLAAQVATLFETHSA